MKQAEKGTRRDGSICTNINAQPNASSLQSNIKHAMTNMAGGIYLLSWALPDGLMSSFPDSQSGDLRSMPVTEGDDDVSKTLCEGEQKKQKHASAV